MGERLSKPYSKKDVFSLGSVPIGPQNYADVFVPLYSKFSCLLPEHCLQCAIKSFNYLVALLVVGYRIKLLMPSISQISFMRKDNKLVPWYTKTRYHLFYHKFGNAFSLLVSSRISHLVNKYFPFAVMGSSIISTQSI